MEFANLVKVLLKRLPILSPLLLWPFRRALTAPPGFGFLSVPPALVFIAARLYKQCPLGIDDRKFGYPERLQFYLVSWRFILVKPLITANGISFPWNLDEWRQQIFAIGPFTTF